MKKKKVFSILLCVLVFVVITACFSVTAFAAGDVASAIESTWKAAQSQIKTVVNNVVFPVVDMILAILFFVKVGTSYFEYRKHGQFEFTAPAILFAYNNSGADIGFGGYYSYTYEDEKGIWRDVPMQLVVFDVETVLFQGDTHYYNADLVSMNGDFS